LQFIIWHLHNKYHKIMKIIIDKHIYTLYSIYMHYEGLNGEWKRTFKVCLMHNMHNRVCTDEGGGKAGSNKNEVWQGRSKYRLPK
jgi:hypothetical protein